MRSPAGARRDRDIFRLALPALGALAAEPTYLLVDTAIVGHLGTTELAALAIAATLLTSGVALFNFLTYGTTAQVARLHGAGEVRAAGELAAQALWLALAIGAGLCLLALLAARPAVALMGGDGETADAAVLYLRISAAGLPFALIALAGQGFLRGVGDLKRPLIVVVAANGVNVVLELLFVYGFGWGIAGSAAGTVIAQLGMGAAFAWLLLSAPARSRRPNAAVMRPLLHIGGHIAMRTGALLAAFTLASAVVARMGDASLGAHQIAFQIFLFLALVLDAVAIAGQILVGRALGGGLAEEAHAAARRMIGWSVLLGAAFACVLLALGDLVPGLFTNDPAVVERAEEMWMLFALLQPLGGAVFALDGILIGAGDTRYLAWSMVAGLVVFAPLAVGALLLGLGIVGVWAALLVLMGVRLATCGARFRGRRWAVTGARVAPGRAG